MEKLKTPEFFHSPYSCTVLFLHQNLQGVKMQRGLATTCECLFRHFSSTNQNSPNQSDHRDPMGAEKV